MNILDQKNAAVSLLLIETYLTENLVTFSSTCLKVFFAFLLNTKNPFSEKDHVVAILREQIEQHPGCAEYMSQTYRNVLLKPEEVHFKNLTALDYVLSQLQNQVSETPVCFSASRISRRTRKRVAYFENNNEWDVRGNANSMDEEVPLLDKSGRNTDIVMVLLDILTEILTHDFRATLNRGESPTKCILAALIFKNSSSTLMFQPIAYKIFAVYKLCTTTEERGHVTSLLELVATLCLYVDREQSEANLLHLGSCCSRFVSDFLIDVFAEEVIRESFSMDKITSLNLIWLRYHAAHHVLEKMCCKRISSGVKGVLNELKALLKLAKNGRGSQSDESSPMRNLSQNSSAGKLEYSERNICPSF